MTRTVNAEIHISIQIIREEADTALQRHQSGTVHQAVQLRLSQKGSGMKKRYTEPDIELKEFRNVHTLTTSNDFGDNETDDPFGEL